MRIADIVLDVSEEGDTIHHRHHHVTDHNTHIVVLGQLVECLLAVCRNEHMVLIIQTSLQEQPRILIVVNHQNNGFRRSLFRCGLLCQERSIIVSDIFNQRFIGFCDGQCHCEDGSPRIIVSHIDATSHHIHVLLDDMQTQSATLLLLSVCFLNEAVEDMTLVVHTDSRISHTENQRAIRSRRSLKRNRHTTITHIILIGIRQQVGNNPPHLVLVEVNLHGFLRQLHLQLDLLTYGIEGETLNGLPYKAHNIAMLEIQFLLSHIQSAEIQQLQDKVIKLTGIPPSHIHLCPDRCRQTGLAYLLQRSNHECKRCLEVVTDIGKELNLLFFHLILLQVDFHPLHGNLSALSVR